MHSRFKILVGRPRTKHGLFGCVLSAICFHLHLLQYLNKLEQYHSSKTLQVIDYGGTLASVLGFGFMCWYLTSVVTKRNDFNPELYCMIGSAICSFIFMLVGLYVKISTLIYMEALTKDSRPIITEDDETCRFSL